MFPAVEPNEKDDVPPLGLPKSPPDAGAVVEGLLWLFEEGVEPVFPKLKDMAARLRRSGLRLVCKGWTRDARLRRYRSIGLANESLGKCRRSQQETRRHQRRPQ